MQDDTLRRPPGELFVGTVANGDDQIGRTSDVIEGTRSRSAQVEAGTGSGPDGFGVDARRRLGPGAGGDDLMAGVPQGDGELGAGRVGRTDEEDAVGGQAAGGLTGQGQPVRHEPEVPSAAVPGRGHSFDETGPLEHAQMVGQQVRLDAEPLKEIGGRAIRDGELVDDRQPVSVRQRSMDGHPPVQVR
jgi:hypothetical protein